MIRGSRSDDAQRRARFARLRVRAAHRDQILSYNASQVGPFNDSKYVLTVRSSAGDLAGGLVAVQLWNGMFVDLLWVDENLRHHGIGTQLMRQAGGDLVVVVHRHRSITERHI